MSNVITLISTFEDARNEEVSAKMSAYMKHQFNFLGLPKPIRAILQKPFIKVEVIDWDFVFTLYKLEYREYQYIALDYLIRNKSQLSLEDLPFLRKLVLEKSWWDTVDLIASHLIGAVFLNVEDKSIMLQWSRDEKMWIRRCALLFQLKYKDKTNPILLTQIIENNLESSEFFINKAIGWSLREYSKTNPNYVLDFVATHSLAPLSKREAMKHLSK